MGSEMTSSGVVFEMRVLERLRRELEHGSLGLNPDQVEVHHRKGYYSPQRGKKIVFDVSIDIMGESEGDPFIVWVWECKDYKSPVPVDDIEEFHAKLQQIGADNTKGTVIASTTFQKGALAYAKAQKIGLARLRPDGSRVFIVNARDVTIKDSEIRAALTDPGATRLQSMFYALTTDGRGVASLGSLIDKEAEGV